MKYALLVLWLLSFSLSAQDVKQIPGVYGSSMAYHPTDGHLYVISSSPFNSVTQMLEVDPAFAQVLAAYPLERAIQMIGQPPGGQRLYLGSLDTVFQFDLQSKALSASFRHQMPTTNLLNPIRLVELPNQPGTVAVLWADISNPYFYIGVYDNGIRRPAHVFVVYDIGAIDVAPDGKYLFGYNTYTTASNIIPIRIDPGGLTLLSADYHYIRDFSKGIQYIGDRIYGSDGTVMQVSQDTALRLIGRLPARVGDAPLQGRILPYGEGSDSLYFLSSFGYRVYLSVFHRHNFQRIAQRALTQVQGWDEPYGITSMDQADHVAYFAGANLHIVRSCQSALPKPEGFNPAIRYQCAGDTLALLAPGGYAADRYFWSDGFRGNPYISSSNFDRKLTYRIADDQGCLSDASDPVEAKLVYPPQPPLVSSEGLPTLCSGGGFVTLSAISQSGPTYANQYLWSNGLSGPSIQVTAPGNYSCRAQNAQGCLSDLSNEVAVVLSAAPQPPQPALSVLGGDGDTEVCSTDQAELAAPSGFAAYIWSDGLVVDANPRRPIQQALKVQVTVVSAEGCRSQPSALIELNYWETPPKPQIIRAQQVLGSSAPAGNQWFKDGVPIPGANGQFYTMSQPGSYTVQVSLQAECPSEMSDPVQF